MNGSEKQFSFTRAAPSTSGRAKSNFLSVTVCAGAVLLIATNGQAQNLFVATSSSVIEITPGGAQTTFASGFVNPWGLAFNSAGDLFVANVGTESIIKITPSGAQSTFASGLGLNESSGLAFNSAGDLFVGSGYNGGGYIYEFTPGGLQSTFASGLNSPAGLAFNSAGDLFEMDASSGSINKFTPFGAKSTFSTVVDGVGLAFNRAGDLFVAEGYNAGHIIEITPQGLQSTFASGFNYPQGLAFDSAGNLFVSDSGSIIEITPGGVRSTFASGVSYSSWDLAFQGETLPVPEPSSWLLLMSGIGALFGSCRSRPLRPYKNRKLMDSIQYCLERRGKRPKMEKAP